MDITKMKRSQFLTFLNTTPNGNSATWALLGVGIEDFGLEYNPQMETLKWIVEDNARTTHESNQLQGSVEQQIYLGDPCYEFVNAGRDQLNYKTEILIVDTTTSGTSKAAKKYDATVAVTSYMSDTASIAYDIYFNGDPEEGTATIAGTGLDIVPTYTKTV